MKKFLAILALGLSTLSAAADGNIAVKSVDVSKKDSRLDVHMSLDASDVRLSSNREMVYTPMLVNDTDTLRMPSFTIAGRNRWYAHVRNEMQPDRSLYRSGKITSPIEYSYAVPMEEWMKKSHLIVETQENGCCKGPKSELEVPVAEIDFVPPTFSPAYAYVTPKAEAVKMRSISARAYIDFPVNRTEIYPDYRRNPEELRKIQATIDSVKNDPNLTITGINIHGYASPEGPYNNNVRLAKGRTEELAKYVNSLYHFPKGTFTTQSTPEDWAGLKEYVESDMASTTLTNREGILDIINSPKYANNPDGRNEAIRFTYPADYKFLLENIYPGLRHSDYDVIFSIRDYTDPKEIIETMRTAPQNLSLQELFVAANSVEKGSDTYNEAFEIAAKMYPDDPTANLNAAFCALQRDDLPRAEYYLKKAGDSEEAQYARGILLAKLGKREDARNIFKSLPLMPQARQAEGELNTVIEGVDNPIKVVTTTLP
ncbi:MAG: DUF3868 domain-containing protein [Muribaculaceae bacterium]|nr:DUF3868 domain-containing protein [Muribaculaceae bacterium]